MCKILHFALTSTVARYDQEIIQQITPNKTIVYLFRLRVEALLDFPNVIRPNESNHESETSHYGLDAQKQLSTELQTSLSPCKCMTMALHDVVIPLFGHHKIGFNAWRTWGLVVWLHDL